MLSKASEKMDARRGSLGPYLTEEEVGGKSEVELISGKLGRIERQPAIRVHHKRNGSCPEQVMTGTHRITIDGTSFLANRGETLLDAALNSGVDLPFDCRAGHCGACCVRLTSGELQGGEGIEPGIVHACQCRIIGDAVVEKARASSVCTVEGEVSHLRALSPDVVEVGVRTDQALLYHAGQYAQVCFSGYPSRPFSISHPLRDDPDDRALWFHVRRMKDGRVTPSLGKRIQLGHRVRVTGPYGAAHFRPNLKGRLILIATNTGFAPIWSVAIAALREAPSRMMMVIAGGRRLESLYMGPALEQLARFPNVLVVPVCSTPQSSSKVVRLGRPTDYLPRLLPSDVLYACGAPRMVETIRSIATQVGAACYADPFLSTINDTAGEPSLGRAVKWPRIPTIRRIWKPFSDLSDSRQKRVQARMGDLGHS